MNRAVLILGFAGLATVASWEAAQAGPAPQVWVEDSFEDFADGVFDASGQNIYASRDGRIRTIQRFDINDDGYVDLFFGNTHDLINMVPPTEAVVSADHALTSRSLPVLGANHVEAADLNKDGWTDLAFTLEKSGLQVGREFIRILFGAPEGWTSRRSSVLPANAPRGVAIGDWNGDGWPDIAVLNTANGPITADRNIRVYWGCDTGFLLSQFQDVGLPGAVGLESADLDGDGVADLAALGPESVRVFWGVRTGVERIHAIRDANVSDLWSGSNAAGELLADLSELTLPEGGASSLAAIGAGTVLAVGAAPDAIHMVRTDAGRTLEIAQTVTGFSSSHLSAGDLDGDGFDDLALSNVSVVGRYATAGGEAGDVDTSKLSPVRILWGGAAGFSSAESTALEAWFGTATAIGDMDGDGHLDVSVAVYQGLDDQRFDSESVVYFGRGGRRFERAAKGATTAGTTDTVIVAPEGGVPGRAVFANCLGGTLYERVPNYVYWGGPDGFDPENLWVITGQSGHDAMAADFDADGYVDFAMTFTAHGGPSALKSPIIGTNILWGAAEGLDQGRPRTILPEAYMDSSATADLNRDGYLDIVLGGWEQWYSTAEDTAAEVTVYYGSATGFDPAGKVSLRAEGRSNGVMVADYDKDGWLDISAASRGASRFRIFSGGPEGFSEARQQQVMLPMAMGTEAADFNADGWLDVIVSGYKDHVNRYNDLGNVVLWGGPEGFRQWDAQWLPGDCTLYQAVADFDGDGHLDVFLPNYQGEVHRGDIPSYLYWGGADGFDIKRRTILVCDSAADAVAGDFNHDGLIDLAVVCHTNFGNHQVDSKIFYNDGDRFRNPVTLGLPTLGAHTLWTQDPGHIYDRKPIQRYESSVFALNGPARSARLRYEADVPAGTQLDFAVRSAATKEALAEAPWRPYARRALRLDSSDRCIQYQAILQSDNGDRYPVIDAVRIELK